MTLASESFTESTLSSVGSRDGVKKKNDWVPIFDFLIIDWYLILHMNLILQSDCLGHFTVIKDNQQLTLLTIPSHHIGAYSLCTP